MICMRRLQEKRRVGFWRLEVCTRELRMKNDPYPLHITSALVSMAIVILVWALVG